MQLQQLCNYSCSNFNHCTEVKVSDVVDDFSVAVYYVINDNMLLITVVLATVFIVAEVLPVVVVTAVMLAVDVAVAVVKDVVAVVVDADLAAVVVEAKEENSPEGDLQPAEKKLPDWEASILAQFKTRFFIFLYRLQKFFRCRKRF
jgi:hypothetical protein